MVKYQHVMTVELLECIGNDEYMNPATGSAELYKYDGRIGNMLYYFEDIS